jgi:hypothetical protein
VLSFVALEAMSTLERCRCDFFLILKCMLAAGPNFIDQGEALGTLQHWFGAYVDRDRATLAEIFPQPCRVLLHTELAGHDACGIAISPCDSGLSGDAADNRWCVVGRPTRPGN